MNLKHLQKKILFILLASIPLFFCFQNCSSLKLLSIVTSTPTKANSSEDLASEINDSYKEIKSSEKEIRIPATALNTADDISTNTVDKYDDVNKKDVKIKLKRARKKHK
jgi:hypothetical protein